MGLPKNIYNDNSTRDPKFCICFNRKTNPESILNEIQMVDPISDFLSFNHDKIFQREDNGHGLKKKAPSN